MFEVTKHARMKKALAETTYGPLTLASTTLVDGYYTWPFTIQIIGAGDSVPADYDPKNRYRFKIAATYTEDDLIADIKKLVAIHGVPRVARGTSRGVDLECRDDSKPEAVGKMSDAKRQAWVIANAGEALYKAMSEKGSALTPADFLAIYADLNESTVA